MHFNWFNNSIRLEFSVNCFYTKPKISIKEALFLMFDFDFVQLIFNILSILGFIMSGILTAVQIFSKRKNINVFVCDYAKRTSVVQLFTFIQNNSKAGITINSFSIIENDKQLQCELIPKTIYKKDTKFIMSPMFPINLAPNQGYSCFLEFLFCEEIQLYPDKILHLRIHTNLGTIDKSLILGSTSHYLHKKI